MIGDVGVREGEIGERGACRCGCSCSCSGDGRRAPFGLVRGRSVDSLLVVCAT